MSNCESGPVFPEVDGGTYTFIFNACGVQSIVGFQQQLITSSRFDVVIDTPSTGVVRLGSVIWNASGLFDVQPRPQTEYTISTCGSSGVLLITRKPNFSWYFQTFDFFSPRSNTEGIFEQSIVTCSNFGLGSRIIVAEPAPEGCPSIEILAYTTRDKKQICQVGVRVVTPPGPCQDCPCSESRTFAQTLRYKHYSPNIASVLKGKGCTFADKVASIGGIDINDLARYALLRLVLAQIIFGDFNVDYLLQKWYQPLRKKLACSQFCRFLSRLDGHYDKLFY